MFIKIRTGSYYSKGAASDVTAARAGAGIFKMDELESRLCAQIRAHRHLYDKRMREHKDFQMAHSTWRQISAALGKDEAACRKLWKNLRDRYVKAKKRAQSRGGARRGSKPAPILSQMDWLSEFVSHRAAETDVETEDKMTELVPAKEGIESGTETTQKNTTTEISCLLPGKEDVGSGTEITQKNTTTELTCFVPAKEDAGSLAETPQSSTPTRGTSPPLFLPVKASAVAPAIPPSPSPTPSVSLSTSSFLSASPPRTPGRKRKRATEDMLCERLMQMHEERMWFLKEYREERRQDTPEIRFGRVIADMLTEIDPAFRQEAKHKLFQVLVEYTMNRPLQPCKRALQQTQ